MLLDEVENALINLTCANKRKLSKW